MASCGVCVSVRLSVTFVDSVKTNKQYFLSSGSAVILVVSCQTSWQYPDCNPSKWGRQKSRFRANIWLHNVLCTLGAASAIHSVATDHGELKTQVAGNRRSLTMAETTTKCMTKSLNVTSKTAEQYLIMQW